MSKSKIIMPTAEEDAAINRGIAADPDTVEVQPADFASMKKLGARGRPRIESPKVLLSVRYDADVVEAFKASGEGWQKRMNDALLNSLVPHSAATRYLTNVLSRRDSTLSGAFGDAFSDNANLVKLLLALGAKGYAINYEVGASGEVFESFDQAIFDSLCVLSGHGDWSGVALKVRELMIDDRKTGGVLLIDQRHAEGPIVKDIQSAMRSLENTPGQSKNRLHF